MFLGEIVTRYFPCEELDADVFVERKFALIHEVQRTDGRNRLADGPGLKQRFRRHRGFTTLLGDAVAFRLDDLAPLHDREGKPGDLLLLHLGEDNAVDGVVG